MKQHVVVVGFFPVIAWQGARLAVKLHAVHYVQLRATETKVGRRRGPFDLSLFRLLQVEFTSFNLRRSHSALRRHVLTGRITVGTLTSEARSATKRYIIFVPIESLVQSVTGARRLALEVAVNGATRFRAALLLLLLRQPANFVRRLLEWDEVRAVLEDGVLLFLKCQFNREHRLCFVEGDHADGLASAKVPVHGRLVHAFSDTAESAQIKRALEPLLLTRPLGGSLAHMLRQLVSGACATRTCLS